MQASEQISSCADLTRQTQEAAHQLLAIVEKLETNSGNVEVADLLAALQRRIQALSYLVHRKVVMDTLRRSKAAAARAAVLLLSVLALASVAQAQPANANIGDTVAWDHDGKNLGYFEVNWDFGDKWISTDQNKSIKIPALPTGLHTVYVRACNGPSSCSDNVSLQFQIVAIAPNPVTGLRLTKSATNTATPASAKVPARPAAPKP